MNNNETSLQVITDDGILKKIIKFFKKLINKKEVKHTLDSVIQKNDDSEINNFRSTIKYTEDPDRNKLIKIQEELERIGINKKNAFLLTKELSEIQKKKLLELYNEQIDSLNTSINNYKAQIVKIRKTLLT